MIKGFDPTTDDPRNNDEFSSELYEAIYTVVDNALGSVVGDVTPIAEDMSVAAVDVLTPEYLEVHS